jgi:hypothetical protein
MPMRYPGHVLKTRRQATAQGAVILAILGPLLAWRISTEPAAIAMALTGLTIVPFVIAIRAWRLLARQELRHQEPTPEMAFLFQLVATMPLVIGAFLMMLMVELGR